MRPWVSPTEPAPQRTAASRSAKATGTALPIIDVNMRCPMSCPSGWSGRYSAWRLGRCVGGLLPAPAPTCIMQKNSRRGKTNEALAFWRAGTGKARDSGPRGADSRPFRGGAPISPATCSGPRASMPCARSISATLPMVGGKPRLGPPVGLGAEIPRHRPELSGPCRGDRHADPRRADRVHESHLLHLRPQRSHPDAGGLAAHGFRGRARRRHRQPRQTRRGGGRACPCGGLHDLKRRVGAELAEGRPRRVAEGQEL